MQIRASLSRWRIRLLNALPWLSRFTSDDALRRLHQAHRLREGKSYLCKSFLGDCRVNVDPAFEIERMMLLDCYEPHTLSVISRFVKTGDVCFDIGANVGSISLALAKAAGPSGKVVAFEPGPPTQRRLRKNVELNPNYREVISVVPMGVSSRPGTLRWKEHDDNPGNASLDAHDGQEVRVTTVDIFTEQNSIDQVDFIKIDVEGMEYEVLLGAVDTLATSKPIVYFETLNLWEERRKRPLFPDMMRLLTDLGYVCFAVTEEGGFEEAAELGQCSDSIAIPRQRAEHLIGQIG